MNPSLFVLKAPPAVPDYAPCDATCDTTCDATGDATGGTSCDPVSPKDAVHEQAGFLRASVAGADVATPEGGSSSPELGEENSAPPTTEMTLPTPPASHSATPHTRTPAPASTTKQVTCDATPTPAPASTTKQATCDATQDASRDTARDAVHDEAGAGDFPRAGVQCRATVSAVCWSSSGGGRRDDRRDEGVEGASHSERTTRERTRQLATPSRSGLDERRRWCWCGEGWMRPWRRRGGEVRAPCWLPWWCCLLNSECGLTNLKIRSKPRPWPKEQFR